MLSGVKGENLSNMPSALYGLMSARKSIRKLAFSWYLLFGANWVLNMYYQVNTKLWVYSPIIQTKVDANLNIQVFQKNSLLSQIAYMYIFFSFRRDISSISRISRESRHQPEANNFFGESLSRVQWNGNWVGHAAETVWNISIPRWKLPRPIGKNNGQIGKLKGLRSK